MQLPHWQFITQGSTPEEHVLFAQIAIEQGCPWVQLRMKETPQDIFISTAQKLKKVCKAHHALLFINDNVEVAQTIQADGIHLGKNDMPPSEAKKLLPTGTLMGGTANTWEDIQYLQNEGVDYVGLGPYTFTTTKKNLDPTLGVEGYQEIILKMKKYHFNMPIFAIGGIDLDDIDPIMQTGVHGIAVSGLLAKAPNEQVMVDVIHEKLEKWIH